MFRLLRPRNLVLSLAALALTAAAMTTSAVFEAPAPGADLSPLGGADQLIEILQGNETVLWTSLSGPVDSYRVEGWPETIEGNDLGGGLVIERTDAEAGVIDLGQKPRSLTFDIEG